MKPLPNRSINKRRFQQWFIQLVFVTAVVSVFWFLAGNAAYHLEQQDVATGFGFLSSPTGFDIIFHLIDYDESASYGRAFAVAVLNTLLVSGLGIIAATILGFLVGTLSLSEHPLIKGCCKGFVEVLRNIPLLLQIFFWYFAVLRALPSPRQSMELWDMFYLNIRGFYFPWFESGAGWFDWSLSIPHLAGFNFKGGRVLIPELIALWLALTMYTASYIAEIVRSGIASVPKGQIEAARALSLSRWDSLRLIIIPQAMRLIIPPLTSQYLNLTKNSSLGAAIAYPELVLVFASTVLNHTGQAVEVIFLTMFVYLLLSLTISAAMNIYNSRIMR